MARSLQQRLDQCAKRGALSTADLALWFDLAYHSMRGYLEGVTPHASRQPQIEQRLKWLEMAVRHDPRFPVPLQVRQGERPAYILKIRADYAR